MPQHGTIHDSLYNAFGFGLFAKYELESEDRELLQRLISASEPPTRTHIRTAGLGAGAAL